MSEFGLHLTLDLSECDPLLAGDMAHIYRILDELPARIGMTKIIPPYVFPYCGIVPADKGITGVVIIAESHITIHTFTEKDFAFCDVFSCRAFDTQAVTAYLTDALGAQRVEVTVIRRGQNFPR